MPSPAKSAVGGERHAPVERQSLGRIAQIAKPGLLRLGGEHVEAVDQRPHAIRLETAHQGVEAGTLGSARRGREGGDVGRRVDIVRAQKLKPRPEAGRAARKHLSLRRARREPEQAEQDGAPQHHRKVLRHHAGLCRRGVGGDRGAAGDRRGEVRRRARRDKQRAAADRRAGESGPGLADRDAPGPALDAERDARGALSRDRRRGVSPSGRWRS